jgi:trehalose-6-phosphate synthase
MFRYSIMRIFLALALAAAIATYFGVPYISDALNAGYRVQTEHRAAALIRSSEPKLRDLMERHDRAGLRAFLASTVARNSWLQSLVVCRPDGSVISPGARASDDVACRPDPHSHADAGHLIQTTAGRLQISDYEISGAGAAPFRAVVVQDLGFADWSQSGWRGFVVAFVGMSALGLALVVSFVIWWLLRRWATLLLSDIRSGRLLDDARSPGVSWPILSQVRNLLRDAEANQRLEIDYRENWTPQALRQVVQQQLQSSQVITVSNRQPYSHRRNVDGQVQVQVPASGMVTALEPIMRACSGVWIAHGSGDADRSAVDAHDRVPVPPDAPNYTLRRVWLSPEEEEGYYFGFSNEGLWPLCHQAYVRPEFRDSDWHCYQSVNKKFADAVVQEADSANPVVLIQDFHFALLPRLLRQRIPRATIGLFWHVPWPNPETFGVCPWQRELLSSLLQADVLGFHTRYHCHNLLDTVDRAIECKVDREHMTVTLRGHVCHVAPYPISIEWPPRWLSGMAEIPVTRAQVRRDFGIDEGVFLGVGVERWDFTKGIVERCQALEAYLDRHPRELGRVTLLQVAEPSRSKLPAYRALQERTLLEVQRINSRFQTDTWRPIILVPAHQDPRRVFEMYRAADFCMVTSLHDGMNLVAKEFVAARDDEDGVLILSTFTGAARELVEALLVNPFNVGELASAIGEAIRMSRDQRRQRMRLMRQTVRENNVYRWAGRMLVDIARIRQRQSIGAQRRMAIIQGSAQADPVKHRILPY